MLNMVHNMDLVDLMRWLYATFSTCDLTLVDLDKSFHQTLMSDSEEESPKLTCITSDGQKFTVDALALRQSHFLRNMISDLDAEHLGESS